MEKNFSLFLELLNKHFCYTNDMHHCYRVTICLYHIACTSNNQKVLPSNLPLLLCLRSVITFHVWTSYQLSPIPLQTQPQLENILCRMSCSEYLCSKTTGCSGSFITKICSQMATEECLYAALFCFCSFTV